MSWRSGGGSGIVWGGEEGGGGGGGSYRKGASSTNPRKTGRGEWEKEEENRKKPKQRRRKTFYTHQPLHWPAHLPYLLQQYDCRQRNALLNEWMNEWEKLVAHIKNIHARICMFAPQKKKRTTGARSHTNIHAHSNVQHRLSLSFMSVLLKKWSWYSVVTGGEKEFSGLHRYRWSRTPWCSWAGHSTKRVRQTWRLSGHHFRFVLASLGPGTPRRDFDSNWRETVYIWRTSDRQRAVGFFFDRAEGNREKFMLSEFVNW